MATKGREISIVPTSKESVIAQFKKQLPLPDYCAENWDSFEECLLDFLEGAVDRIYIIHQGEVEMSSKDKVAYLSILRDARRAHDLVVIG
jgi:hypothetical protein